uniref:Cytochrome P450 3A13 n=1 Tax=Ganoderma boninense TaxID=34458 RepID=A0A5K1JYB1_9APHY|nr:Cytochrome P450 3A13 [Ganoderma boninense]
MSFAFRRLCRELDKENIKNHGVLIGDQGSGGNGPRVREDATPTQEAETRAPVGLWRDCYDSTWLAGLKSDQVRRLDIIDEDFGLSLPHSDEEEDEEEEEAAPGAAMQTA